MIASSLSRNAAVAVLAATLVVAGTAPRAAAQGGAIVLGEAVAGLVTVERGDPWTIELRQGMFVRIDVTRERTSSLVPEVALVDASGRVVATARAGSGAGTVRLTVNCLARGGRYSLLARSVDGRLGGRYTLKIEPIMVAAELGAETVPCATTDEANERARGECTRPSVRVEAGGEPVRVPRGETRNIVLANGTTATIACDPQAAGEAAERVACADGTTFLRVTRQPNGRTVEWTCFSRRFIDGPEQRIGDRMRLTRAPGPGDAAGPRADAAPADR